MSNKWNKPRLLLMRPKVCKSKPPVEAPKPVITCSITPFETTMDELDVQDEELLGENPAFGPDTVIEISFPMGLGLLDFPETLLNGGTTSGTYTADFGPYDETIVITLTWPDMSTCLVSVTWHVTVF